MPTKKKDYILRHDELSKLQFSTTNYVILVNKISFLLCDYGNYNIKKGEFHVLLILTNIKNSIQLKTINTITNYIIKVLQINK